MRNPSTLGARARRRLFIGLCSALAVCSTIVLSAAFSGAIYTSLVDGETVNQNQYASKDLVYLNGGPQNENGRGMPDGIYYYQVTDPSGEVLLSSDQAVCRTLQVTGGVVAGAAPGPCPHPDGEFNPANGSRAVQLVPFDNTPNNGGEYKVWLVPLAVINIQPDGIHVTFPGGNKKTDNFKVDNDDEGTPTDNEISGTKFYDANVNGIQDAGELGIPGWQIEINIPSNTTTDANGNYIFLDVLDGTSYEVCEVIPALAPTWIPTTPTSISGISVPPDSTGNDFGNVCLGAGGGKTLGFWSNKNGEKIFTPNGGLAIVNLLPLVNGTGASSDFANHAAFKSWLLGASATNMAYMLSAQLAAMKLNATIGDVDGDAYLLAGACGNTGIDNKFITVDNLIAAAVAQLVAHPFTTAASDPVNRGIQECLKNALDKGNNNLNFVQDEACEVNYSGLEASCLLPD